MKKNSKAVVIVSYSGADRGFQPIDQLRKAVRQHELTASLELLEEAGVASVEVAIFALASVQNGGGRIVNRTPTVAQVALENPCQYCGYTSANLLRIWGSRHAARCGKCDTFQYAITLSSKRQKGRAGL